MPTSTSGVLDLGDPLAQGRRNAGVASKTAASGDLFAEAFDEASDGEASVDFGEFGDDVLDELERELGVDQDDLSTDVPALARLEAHSGNASASSHGPMEDAAGAAVLEDAALQSALAEDAGSAEPEQKPATVQQAVAAAVVSSSGHVSCPLSPFSSRAFWARITTFPDTAPMENRSVSCYCYLHPKCSVAKKRRMVSDEKLLEWAFSGVDEPGASRERRTELGKTHKELWHRMMRGS